MFAYELLRNQWVMIALFGGLALVFYFVLHFQDYYLPRKHKANNREEYETNHMGAWQAIPWSVKVTIIVILIFGITYSIYVLLNPQSW